MICDKNSIPRISEAFVQRTESAHVLKSLYLKINGLGEYPGKSYLNCLNLLNLFNCCLELLNCMKRYQTPVGLSQSENIQLFYKSTRAKALKLWLKIFIAFW